MRGTADPLIAVFFLIGGSMRSPQTLGLDYYLVVISLGRGHLDWQTYGDAARQ